MSLYPKARPLSTRGTGPCQKRPSVVISLLLPLGAIYPHPGLENYPHCPHPYPPRPEISAFLAVDKAVERACERLPPVLWARDRCGSLPRIMRSGHIAGQRGPSCKLWGNLLLSHLFLFGEKKKVREKEKHKWENGGFRLSGFLALLLHQQLVSHKRYKFAIGGLVVLAVDVVAEEGVEVFDAWATPRPKRLLGTS